MSQNTQTTNFFITEPKNIAFKKSVFALKFGKKHPLSNIVDENLNTYSEIFNKHFIIIDLHYIYDVDEVELFSRTDCCGVSLNNFKVGLYTERNSKSDFNEHCFSKKGNVKTNSSKIVKCKKDFFPARFISIKTPRKNPPLYIAEVKAYGSLYPVNRIFQYYGCFNIDENTNNYLTVISIQECIYKCQYPLKKIYAAINKIWCTCLDEINSASHFANKCHGSCRNGDINCGSGNFYSVYYVQSCLNNFNDPYPHCLIKDCVFDNICGKYDCMLFNIGKRKIGECNCVKKNYFSKCTKILNKKENLEKLRSKGFNLIIKERLMLLFCISYFFNL